MHTLKTCGALAVLLMLALSLAGCLGEGDKESKVYEGVCQTMGPDGKTITLANSQPKLNPIKGDSATFELAGAKIGLPPEKGNLIRLAYFQEGKRLVAIKVMNVTKQDLRKK